MNGDSGILNVSVFGSFGRGNSDAFNDLDILVVCRDGSGAQPEEIVRSMIFEKFDQPPSISWYGSQKILNFFETGDLFAWHLYAESYALPGYADLAEIYGKPAPYRNCLDDVKGLQSILETIPDQIRRNPQNMLYEMGLVYVCLRNIAMTASSVLCEKVDFGRNSPYALPEIPLPISRASYDFLARCRHASTRGGEAPDVDIDVDAVLRESLLWAKSVERTIQ